MGYLTGPILAFCNGLAKPGLKTASTHSHTYWLSAPEHWPRAKTHQHAPVCILSVMQVRHQLAWP